MLHEHVQPRTVTMVEAGGAHRFDKCRKVIRTDKDIDVLSRSKGGFVNLSDPSPYCLATDHSVRNLCRLQDVNGSPKSVVDLFHGPLHPLPELIEVDPSFRTTE